MPLVVLVLTLAVSLASVAYAQEASPPRVLDHALSHPTPNVPRSVVVSIGASLPETVEITVVEWNDVYGYVYVDGVPAIVDLSTRSIVFIGTR